MELSNEQNIQNFQTCPKFHKMVKHIFYALIEVIVTGTEHHCHHQYTRHRHRII